MIFPLAVPALIVILDGRIVRSYQPAVVRAGHVVAPVEPYLTTVARSIAINGRNLVIARGDRFAQVALRDESISQQWDATYVEIVPVLRTLGARIDYDAVRHTLTIEFPPSAVALPTPFNPAVPQSAPAAVFTPAPVATPRPVVTGKPSPRRTPLPCCIPFSRLP